MTALESIDQLKIERKRAESMLRMLEGNTEPADIKKLRNEWLVPILESLTDLQQRGAGAIDQAVTP